MLFLQKIDQKLCHFHSTYVTCSNIHVFHVFHFHLAYLGTFFLLLSLFFSVQKNWFFFQHHQIFFPQKNYWILLGTKFQTHKNWTIFHNWKNFSLVSRYWVSENSFLVFVELSNLRNSSFLTKELWKIPLFFPRISNVKKLIFLF